MVFLNKKELFSKFGLKPVLVQQPCKEELLPTIILVLGSIDPIIRTKRIEKGIELYSSLPQKYEDRFDEYITHQCTYLLFSGGIVPNQITASKIIQGERPEAELMREYAIFRGVNPNVIKTEGLSLNTYQNIENVYAMLKANFPRLNEKGIIGSLLKLIIVSSPTHLPRVKLMVKHLIKNSSINIEFIPCDDPPTEERIEHEKYLTKSFIDFVEKNTELPKKKFSW